MKVRRSLALALVLSLLAPLAGEAQQAKKIPRVGFMSMGSPTSPTAVNNIGAFREGLREQGYVEGSNIIVDYRYAEGRPERFSDFASEFVQQKVDVIVAGAGTVAAIGARQVTASIPIVMSISGDPVALGLAASLARPGGNVTGQTQLSPELSWKRLEFLNELHRAPRVAVLWNPTNPEAARSLQETEGAARALGIVLRPVEAKSPDDFGSAFEAARRGHAAAAVVNNDSMFLNNRARIVDLARRNRLPTMYPWKEAVVDGGLMSFGPNLLELHRSAAGYVAKILRGSNPAELPIAQPTKFELVINLKTAKALGLTIPPSVLLHADQVIE